ncbi:MAG: prephenate dehydratase domain-containing protein [Verrucomicrobiota bacterium]
MKSIAYLGPEGTFSAILARQRFGEGAGFLDCATIEGVFDRVLSGEAGLGLIPVENSSGGTIYDTVDLLIRHAGRITIREELSLDIRIALLGHAGNVVRTVYSHFIQIKHHGEWLKQNLPSARLVPVASTAVAARRAAEGRNAAALASPGTAALYGLDVIEFPSGAEAVNVTNFFVISRPSAAARKPGKTALIAALRNECGSLHKFLGPFAREHVSLTRIVSRPVPGQPQTYVFYVEIEGGPGTPAVKRALDRAGKIARSLTGLGTFPLGRRFSS